ncbi:glycoside hydrolase family protein [Aestuariivivens marinum]|uniref:glycoside hydrolase family protein n=1 Tax=Aestuariivivens marinum TaxID=2913555 RepID=UPI001F592406|nr:glycoside hydrolase family protein [Aestuariivivens marinum]
MRFGLFSIFLLITLLSCNSKKTIELNVIAGPIDAKVNGSILEGASVLNDSSRFVWGGSVVKGDDNKYHMLYSTWECGDSLPAFGQSWVLHSKIAYAVSDYPDRDFKFQKMVLEGKALTGDSLAWDAQMVHNPHIKKFNNTYYLYFIGSRDPGIQAEGSPGYNLSKRDRVQQNQKIGVIAFDDFNQLITGNFKRPEAPLLSPRTRVKPNNIVNPSPEGTITKPDNIIVVNPSVVQRPSDGKYLLYFKGNIYIPNWRGVHGVAISDSPTGPFVPLDNYVFDIKMDDGSIASAEDPYVWYHNLHQKFYAVFKDFTGRITDDEPALAILESVDGIVWSKPEKPLFMKKEVVLKLGDTIKVKNLERPQLLFDNDGFPTTLYCASALVNVGNLKNGSTFNVQIPLKPQQNKK